MHSFKSTPLIDIEGNSQRLSRRDSRNLQKDIEYKIANPFLLGTNNNHLPENLQQQLQNQEYLSKNQIQGMVFNNHRRSSNFLKHLQAMQNAAQQQQAKFKHLLQTKQNDKNNYMQEEEVHITFEDGDNLSIGMNQCLLDLQYRQDPDELNMFDIPFKEDQTIFYSHSQIEYPRNQYESYFQN